MAARRTGADEKNNEERRMARLQDKVAIVTGAAQGIGAASAAALAAEGAIVIATDLKQAVGEATVAAIRDAGGRAEFATLDASDRAGWDRVVADAVARHGRIDVLVNNAGIDIAATIDDARIEDFQRILEINLYSQFHGIQAVIPHMRAAGGGSIVNIASLATRKMAPTSVLYAPSKAAVAALTKTSAIHLAQQGTGIRLNSIHPGPTATAILLGEDGARAESPDIKAAIGMIPMGRMGEIAELGAVVVFLASDESRYMTGAELFVDGGLGLI
jgi:3alpha(or 20beta)-hydroxysteroid dehydrogenase